MIGGAPEYNLDAGDTDNGGDDPDVDPAVLQDQALLNKLEADRKYANDVLKVDSTPTFFINGEKVKGDQSFEEFDKRIKPLLKN